MLIAGGFEIWDSLKLVSVAAWFAKLADCTISSIRFAKSRGIIFTLDSKGVNCQ